MLIKEESSLFYGDTWRTWYTQKNQQQEIIWKREFEELVKIP